MLQKPIMNLNSTDINQLRSVLIGGIQNMNHTMRSLQQLNDIVGYFNQNETQVAMQVDNNDMNVSYKESWYITMTELNYTGVLPSDRHVTEC